MKINNLELNNALYFLYKKLKVISIRKINKRTKSDWFFNEILGTLSYSFECNLVDGNSFIIDLDEDGEFLVLSKLFIKEKGTGLGHIILKILKEYIIKEKKYFLVVQVINQDFFRKFEWLEEDSDSSFLFDLSC